MLHMISRSSFCSKYHPLHQADGYEPKHLYNNYSTSFRDVFFKNLISFYRLTRPYTWTGTVIAITSVSFLPIQNLADLTPTFFMGILKALVPAVLMNIYVVTLNQLYDVEIDKVNKPDLPLASGDFSRGTGIAIALISSLTLPFLRWKGHPFLAPFSMMILMGLVYQLLFFIHIQDVPDVDGDRKFDIQTLSVIVGRERVFWFCVYMMLTAYGAAILVGASSSFPLSKLVTVICHSILAFILWLRAKTVDLSSNASTLSFYMFIWKVHYVEYLLIHFVR
ncbi:homogentisate phytyltransferase 1 [Citrus sinensis]|uniref:Homogentisate phytyltransferase 1 n=1 Tax=Citrus sinensis TaxID=2711 RepID=A0ACB8JD53_CITSI|nr:homogentisate phytyltransferase 1 [Citrus sinensis]